MFLPGAIFSARGFRTVTASSGAETLEQLNHEPPDYLLLGIHMPNMSGLDVLKIANAQHPNVTTVIVTAFQDAELVRTALELGAADYITKPFAMDDQAWARVFFAQES